MWEGLDNHKQNDYMRWLVVGMINTTNTWFTVNSFDIEQTLKVSSTGLMSYFVRTDKRLVGNFFEISYDKGS